MGHHIQWDPGIPVHFNCRSSAKPWMRDWKDLHPRLRKSWKEAGKTLEDMDDAENRIRAGMDGPVKQSVSYEQFLRSQPVDFQQEVMGMKRWDLWKDGKLTQTDLVDQYSRPLSVEELEALIDSRRSDNRLI